MRMDVVAVLQRAKEQVQKGWVQNTARDGGRVCAAQALAIGVAEVTGLDVEIPTMIENPTNHPLEAAHELTYRHWGSVPMWNDHEGRTKEEVVDTFDHAIKLAERDAA